MFPPLPDWNGLHPMVVHYPIALLTVAPLFVLLAVVVPKHGPWFGRFAFLLLLLGTIAAFVAVETGEAAAEFVTHGPAVEAVLKEHKEHAERVRAMYVILTVLYGVNVVLLPTRVKKLDTRTFAIVANGVMLVFLLAATVLLARTAHEGARLVHEFGIQAIMPAAAGAPPDENYY